MTLLVASLAAVACASNTAESGSTVEPGRSLRVATFNIRYGTANDGDDRWELRRDLVISCARSLDADLLGLQEALDFQVRELAEALPRYEVIGIGRDADGGGEQTTLLVDAERFEVERSGTFWLSDEPEVPGSRGWDAALHRICTWAELVDLRTGRDLVWLNTHFDHRGQRAREESGRLIHDRLDEFSGRPVLVTGDLNAGETNPALAAIRGERLVDTFRVVEPGATDVGTFNGFRGRTDGEKIDYVLCTRQWTVLDAWIDRTEADGRYPSDHFPVAATVVLP